MTIKPVSKLSKLKKKLKTSSASSVKNSSSHFPPYVSPFDVSEPTPSQIQRPRVARRAKPLTVFSPPPEEEEREDNSVMTISSDSEDIDTSAQTRGKESVSDTVNKWIKAKVPAGDAASRLMIQELAKVPGVNFKSTASRPLKHGDVSLAIKETNSNMKRVRPGAPGSHSSTTSKKPAGLLKGKGKQKQQSTKFFVGGITFIPDGVDSLLRNTQAEDDSFEPDLVDCLPSDKAPGPVNLMILKAQLVSAIAHDPSACFEFDSEWSYEEVTDALSIIFPILFQYLDTLIPEAYSDDDEAEASPYQSKSVWLLALKSRAKVSIVPNTPFPTGRDLQAVCLEQKSWSKGRHIMQLPAPQIVRMGEAGSSNARSRRASEKRRRSPSVSDEFNFSEDEVFEKDKHIAKRTRFTRSMTGSRPKKGVKPVAVSSGKESDNSSIGFMDENDASWWCAYDAGDYDAADAILSSSSGQQNSSAINTDIAGPSNSGGAATRASSPVTTELQKLAGGSFSASMNLSEDPWSAVRSYDIG
ncbi:hypothetical protein GALMADRAFT_147336 [Galerina marginata CBS 339.88]|uniref:Uncharacterized protein n=1 Tax=Galerina marginata (strain CBS 339.88) TaxID=685588 RepID=A0A067S8H0_GALM3|nr:hypothetical protein GALMADRAFT_147336 [Galerina marginata CBS 339.88]